MVRTNGSPAFLVVSTDDIARRAYQIYVERGRADGFAREDWLRAERELKAPPAVARGKASTTVAKAAKRARP